MAVARDLAVNASLPWPTKISAHRASLAVVSGSHTSTCPTSVAWWYWLRRTSSVVAMATPIEPPMLRMRLNAAVALGSRVLGIVEIDSVVSGRNRKPIPKPCTKRGHTRLQ